MKLRDKMSASYVMKVKQMLHLFHVDIICVAYLVLINWSNVHLVELIFQISFGFTFSD